MSVGLLQVFHVEWAVIGRNRSRLSNRVNVPHIVNRRSRVAVEGLDVRVNVFSTVQTGVKGLGICTYVGSSSGTREALKARGLNGPPEKGRI